MVLYGVSNLGLGKGLSAELDCKYNSRKHFNAALSIQPLSFTEN